MTHDVQTIIVGLLTIVATGMSFALRELWSSYKDLRKTLDDLKDELPQRYLQRDDFKTFRTEIMDAISRLESYLRETRR